MMGRVVCALAMMRLGGAVGNSVWTPLAGSPGGTTAKLIVGKVTGRGGQEAGSSVLRAEKETGW